MFKRCMVSFFTSIFGSSATATVVPPNTVKKNNDVHPSVTDSNVCASIESKNDSVASAELVAAVETVAAVEAPVAAVEAPVAAVEAESPFVFIEPSLNSVLEYPMNVVQQPVQLVMQPVAEPVAALAPESVAALAPEPVTALAPEPVAKPVVESVELVEMVQLSESYKERIIETPAGTIAYVADSDMQPVTEYIVHYETKTVNNPPSTEESLTYSVEDVLPELKENEKTDFFAY